MTKVRDLDQIERIIGELLHASYRFAADDTELRDRDAAFASDDQLMGSDGQVKLGDIFAQHE